MSKPKILLANEAGGGRGHVTLLASVVQALGSGLPVSASLPSLRHAGELAGVSVTRGPHLRYSAEARADPRLVGNATWGDYLAACGLTSPDIVRAHLRWWRRRIVDEDASILVADYAPMALWAAQGLKAEGWDIEILSVGTGFGLPPARLERFPQLLADYTRNTITEPEVLAVLNGVAVEEGMVALPSLPAVARADQELAFTLPYLDPYAALRRPDETFVPVLAPLPPLSGGPGDELFVYFSRRELDDAALVEALAGLTIPRRGYLPGAPAETLDRLRRSGMLLESVPLSMADIMARTRLVLGSGQHGLQCLAALGGLAQVAVPQHLEQLFHCRQSEARGILRFLPFDRREAGDIASMILEASSDTRFLSAARTHARSIRATYPTDPAGLLVDRLAPLVDRAGRAFR